jgi:tetratricopeptide (TPR) repeat protein
MTKLWAGALLCLGILAGGVLVSCAQKSRDSRDHSSGATQLTDPDDVNDEALMVALAQAKNFHHKAKVYMSDGNLAAATASVRQILSLQFPAGAPEADDVRLDARALLAKLLVSQNQLDEAMRTVEEGLASSQRDSFFVANLYTVEGEIHEARAVQLDGDDATKAKALEERHAAIAAYDKSIKINEKLQKQLTGDR